MHHDYLWQVALLQLPQDVHPLLSLLCDGAGVQLPLELLRYGAQEVERLHGIDEGLTQGDGLCCKSTTLSSFFRAFSSKLLILLLEAYTVLTLFYRIQNRFPIFYKFFNTVVSSNT